MILLIFFLVIFLFLTAGLIPLHQLLQQETAVIQLTGKVADLAVLVLTEGADGGHCTRHAADGILQRRCRLTMVIGNFPAGLQIIRTAQPEVQLHILALQRLVEQLAVPAADVLRGGVGDVYCESVLDQDPKCAEAYLGKLMAEVNVRKKEDLSKAKEPLGQSDNYSKVMRFADESLRESLSKAKELQHKEQLYTEAMACMTAASDEDAYRNASQKFLFLGSYKDASARREQCLQRADRIRADRIQREEMKRKEGIHSRAEKCMRKGTIESYNTAIQLYESIPGFRSSAAQIIECRRKIEEIKAKEAARQVAVEKAKKKAKKIAIIAAPIVCVCIAFVIVLNAVIIPNQKYNGAMDLIDSGDYESAYYNKEDSGNSGNATTDKVFLLSVPEAEKYFSSSEAKKAGKYDTDTGVNYQWWLRTSGYIPRAFNDFYVRYGATLIGVTGAISNAGNTADTVKGVRPAMWVSLK